MEEERKEEEKTDDRVSVVVKFEQSHKKRNVKEMRRINGERKKKRKGRRTDNKVRFLIFRVEPEKK